MSKIRTPTPEDLERLKPVRSTLARWAGGLYPEGLFTCKPWQMALLLLSETPESTATVSDLGLMAAFDFPEFSYFKTLFGIDIQYGCIMAGVVYSLENCLKYMQTHDGLDRKDMADRIAMQIAILESFQNLPASLGKFEPPTNLH